MLHLFALPMPPIKQVTKYTLSFLGSLASTCIYINGYMLYLDFLTPQCKSYLDIFIPPNCSVSHRHHICLESKNCFGKAFDLARKVQWSRGGAVLPG